jgi:hypothetical protein
MIAHLFSFSLSTFSLFDLSGYTPQLKAKCKDHRWGTLSVERVHCSTRMASTGCIRAATQAG